MLQNHRYLFNHRFSDFALFKKLFCRLALVEPNICIWYSYFQQRFRNSADSECTAMVFAVPLVYLSGKILIFCLPREHNPALRRRSALAAGFIGGIFAHGVLSFFVALAVSLGVFKYVYLAQRIAANFLKQPRLWT